jgi:UDP-N-acetyl-D-mannosaminuronic acid transferase (WecB/TagA/CpsF family)
LDFIAGRALRAPATFQRVGVEWLYRLLHEPRRLGPRYLSNALFLAKAIARDLWA